MPRGGAWGDLVSRALRAQGAHTVIAPLVDFSHTSDEDKLVQALHDLEAGKFDWLTATSPTIADVLRHHQAVINEHTRVATVGATTEAAFIDAGYLVDRCPKHGVSSHELLEIWREVNSENVLNVLTLRSDAAEPVLTKGLQARGHNVTQVLAYRTVGVPASVHIREDIESGRINAILVASERIAHEVAAQFANRPHETIIAPVGDVTLRVVQELGTPQDANDPAHPQYRVKRALIDTVEAVINQSDTLD